MSSEYFEHELSYVGHRLTTLGPKERVPLELRPRIQLAVQDLRRAYATPGILNICHHIMDSLERDPAERVYFLIRRLLDEVRYQRAYSPPHIVELEQASSQRRIAQLEAEVERLSKQLEVEEPEESRDEQESAVKKFNASSNRVFVIMPFISDFDDVWTGAIKRACQENGFAPLRVDQVSLSSWITDDVEEFVKKSTTVIADITGSNPNVLFELGYALAKGKDPIIICQRQDSGKVPFDIAGIRRIEYQNSWQGIEQLARGLKTFLLATLEKQKRQKQKVTKSSSEAKGIKKNSQSH